MKRKVGIVVTCCVATIRLTGASADFLTPIISLWDTPYEVVPSDMYPDGIIELDDPIFLNDRRSAVYAVKDRPDIVIKYEAFCSDKFFEHEEGILNEATYLVLLQDEGVSNKFITHSEGFDLTRDMYNLSVGKILDLSPCDRAISRLDVPRLRYIITERISHTVSMRMRSFLDGRLPFEESIRIGIRLLTLLEKVHSHNVIHGDVHEGNIGYRAGDSFEDLLLIDFGRAMTLPDSEEYPVITYDQIRGTTLPEEMQCNAWLSPWMNLMYPANFRDDVFRAVQVIASAMYGPDYMADQDFWCDTWSGIRKFLRFKLDKNIFDVTIGGTQYRVEDVVRDTKYESREEEITNRLGLILEMVRTSTSKPAIGPIIEQLRLILAE